MSRKTALSIACASGFWGDTPLAVGQLLREPKLDYIVFDYLSEVTMTILAKLKKRDPQAGYAADFFTDVIERHLSEILSRKIRLISNAGGLNPLALKKKIEEYARSKNLPLSVACVLGDDLLGAKLPETVTDLTGKEHSTRSFVSANAYLGASAVTEALALGADIVLLGRTVDTALVVGPIVHEFGYGWDQYDLLAQASLAGHLIECGAQCCGGNFTDWQSVPKKEDVGFPIVRFQSSGSFELTKAPGTGGLITEASVAEQLLYEIGDPTSYLLPDVTCDFSRVRLRQKGDQTVEVGGARGRAPSPNYKVCATFVDGWKLSATGWIEGGEAIAKACSVGDTVLARARLALGRSGWEDFSETRVEALGGPSQALVRVSAAHPKTEALEVLAKEMAPAATSLAPGLTNLLGGRAQPTPRVGLVSFLIEKNRVSPSVTDGKLTRAVSVSLGEGSVERAEARPVLAREFPSKKSVSVPLSKIAYARSGDKGNDVNIGVKAREEKQYEFLKHWLTPERVGEFFSEDFDGAKEVEVWELPGISALNFLLKNCLGGGGAYSLKVDPQGKAFAQRLLDQKVSVPEEIL